jgi:hypothetical protein
MAYDIVIGRNERDRKKYGTKGSILLGRHYVQMGQTVSMSSKVFMDMSGSHAVFICGKRGSGKSYTMGVIAEGMADLPVEIKDRISVIMLDTMGIYWTMKYPNQKPKEIELIKQWGFEPKGLRIVIFTPKGYFKQYKDRGIPTDFPFAIKTSELSVSDWCISFGIEVNDPMGVLIERTLEVLNEKGKDYSIKDIIATLKKDERSKQEVKDAVENRFGGADKWGLFDKEGTQLNDLVIPGQVTVLDVSCYATMQGAGNLRALVIGLVAEKLFIQRMLARKEEEFAQVERMIHYKEEEDEKKGKKKEPLVWLVIDEAHEFLPNQGQTVASLPLITILREGRQPGISLILATQQPGKIHTDVMTQSDIMISHRLTAKIDVQALGMLMQSYMREGLDKELNVLPRLSGSALIFDDNNEKLYPIRVRPRFTWHGGESPSAMVEKKKEFSF